VKETRCRRADAFVRMLEETIRDDRARREWLWLRAREKEDIGSIDSLARADPELPRRMAERDAELSAIADARERREAAGRMLDERVPDTDLIPCDCPECARTPSAG
jgi:hypothetical protein